MHCKHLSHCYSYTFKFLVLEVMVKVEEYRKTICCLCVYTLTEMVIIIDRACSLAAQSDHNYVGGFSGVNTSQFSQALLVSMALL